MKIWHIFNPEHDMALAAGTKGFTPPAAGRGMRYWLGFLPSFWADDGDVVIVRQQSDAETGDIVIVRVDHERATCKRLRKYADGAVELISLNPSYEPMFFAKEELDDDYVVIVGVVVELRGKL